MATLRPTWGVIGLPAGMKEAGKRVDFKTNDFPFLVETKGYRVAWSRAIPCPCAPISDQTKKPDPGCTTCRGIGWRYFGPPTTQDSALYGTLDEVQQRIVDEGPAVVIRAIMTRLEQEQDPDNVASRWVSGTMACTVRSENRLGYYDRIVNLDSEMVYTELVDIDDADVTALRYLATGVNYCTSDAKEYIPGVDFEVVRGDVVWTSGRGPALGDRLSFHYLCHPTWLVIDHPHLIRTTSLKYKTASNKTPQGDPVALPLQATLQYEFML